MYFCLGAYQALTPNIQGNSGVRTDSSSYTTNPFYAGAISPFSGFNQADGFYINIDASKSNPTYVTNGSLRPNSISILVLIKI